MLLAASLSAQTVPAPLISSIQPAAGSVEGGTFVTITGSHLAVPPNIHCFAPCIAMVRFGSAAEVQAVEERDSFITVVTPPHAAGTVDVTVRTGDGRSVTLANAFTYVTTRETGFATYLLPIYNDGDVHGGQGSLWRTEFWIRNNGLQSISLAPWDCPTETCPAVFPLTRALAAGETLRNLPAFLRPPTINPGRLLYVSRDGSEKTSTSLRLWDVSREASDAGTEIPVIHESELRTVTTQLMSVPLRGHLRLMLRIYDIANSESRFRIRIYGQTEGTAPSPPIDEFELTAVTSDPGPFRLQPAYAQRAGIESILQLPNVFPPQIRIEVEPLTPGSLFWTFVSATNNDTQRVTLITPQP
jgi:hypothetical protein